VETVFPTGEPDGSALTEIDQTCTVFEGSSQPQVTSARSVYGPFGHTPWKLDADTGLAGSSVAKHSE
jgi:hypothetical protein